MASLRADELSVVLPRLEELLLEEFSLRLRLEELFSSRPSLRELSLLRLEELLRLEPELFSVYWLWPCELLLRLPLCDSSLRLEEELLFELLMANFFLVVNFLALPHILRYTYSAVGLCEPILWIGTLENMQKMYQSVWNMHGIVDNACRKGTARELRSFLMIRVILPRLFPTLG